MIKEEVGVGDQICLWTDLWFRVATLEDSFPNLFKLEKKKKCKIKERIWWHDNIINWGWNWVRRPSTQVELMEWENIFKVLIMARGCSNAKWLAHPSGEYSVKSVRNCLVQDSTGNANYVLKWSDWVPTKCNIFAWRAVLNWLPMVDNLEKRNIKVEDHSCIVCGEGEDSVNHLFTGCVIVVMVWKKVS
ncbi:uncharacterized protein LOC143546752 [Bidens hawaiensis]|uniref:uncharacterized protein LOC143546752 n=1 Tax=Bidens hawaiensis TaxID=980011 RepID=UPI00404AE222